MKEIFKKLDDYPNYEVSNFGRVKSLSKKVKCRNGYRITNERIMKLKKAKNGYLSVQFGKGGKFNLVHRLVSKTFIKNDKNKPQVNHIDGVKDNNRVDNLEWVTQSENQIHAYKNGLQKISKHKRACGEKVASSKLKEEDIIKIRKAYNGINAIALGKKYGVSQTSILNIKNFKTWKNVRE